MTVARYRPRVFTIEAVRWLGAENCPEVFAFLDMRHSDNDTEHAEIFGIGDNETAHPGDWIIRGLDGQEHVMADENFRASFEAVGDV